jgi:hypothetical protein
MIHSTTLELSDRSVSRPPTNALVAAPLKATPLEPSATLETMAPNPAQAT